MDMEHYAVADGLAPIAASTPWSPAPRGEALGLLAAAWGGGAADDAGALLVWRCAGDVLVLGELALAADDEDVAPPCVALRLASPAPARGDACCRVAPPGAEKTPMLSTTAAVSSPLDARAVSYTHLTLPTILLV